jgi:hypothetical protein
MWVSRAMPTVPCHPFSYGVCEAPWALDSDVPSIHWIQGIKVSYTYEWEMNNADSPRKPYFLFSSECAKSTKRRQWHSKMHEWPRDPVISFTYMASLC